jgi:hypothetical protein
MDCCYVRDITKEFPMRADLDGEATKLLRDRLIGRYAGVPGAIAETGDGRDICDQYKPDAGLRSM